MIVPALDRDTEIDRDTEMCSGSETGSYLRLIDLLYHSTLGVRVEGKKTRRGNRFPHSSAVSVWVGN